MDIRKEFAWVHFSLRTGLLTVRKKECGGRVGVVFAGGLCWTVANTRTKVWRNFYIMR